MTCDPVKLDIQCVQAKERISAKKKNENAKRLDYLPEREQLTFGHLSIKYSIVELDSGYETLLSWIQLQVKMCSLLGHSFDCAVCRGPASSFRQQPGACSHANAHLFVNVKPGSKKQDDSFLSPMSVCHILCVLNISSV